MRGAAVTAPPRVEPSAGPAGGLRRRRWVRLLVVAVGVVGAAVVGLRGRLPDPREFLTALTGAGYGWVVLAVLLQVVSLAAFALQQRRLLDALGVRLRRSRVVAISLAGTALSISLPAGAAVSTGYAIREYERAGASREVAAASAVVSGLASIGGLALLYVGGGAVVLTRAPGGWDWRALAVVAVLGGLIALAVLVGRRQPRRRPAGPVPGPDVSGGVVRRRARALLLSARQAWRAGASLRARDWVGAVGYAAVKWAADLLCLAAAAQALRLSVGVTALAGIYLGVQIVRQVPLTPGGVGVIDTALVAGLTASGATAVSAAAAVLVYRMLSCWLLIPVGGVAGLTLRGERAASRV
ncbi:YbhN family protein [Micromonospora sp. NBC_01412]|uniref:lysylphosphatidylglycerol synthase transmembrane domain-containing protein n=1 Tax=Micromonospora sp. NBC_01412 TaxID=2903590 RepID=UPI003246299D